MRYKEADTARCPDCGELCISEGREQTHFACYCGGRKHCFRADWYRELEENLSKEFEEAQDRGATQKELLDIVHKHKAEIAKHRR